ncbi:VrrA/YqfQ family protein [Bacillus suaedaesalsae]|uniref:YqfQ-like protein n=1 Tax=Bacillus suaedaesalsae TaxID=2810349 RepID=A0ABS2DLB0_9BACI|nr:VrrA/YqfQ family protein [Bacillus suaedaesalsae]MBM6619277.1 hypothetical protein [Bacillus suaedaesalsae]
MFPRGPRMPMRPMNPYYGPRPFQQMPRQFPQRGASGGGGLLSKLFSKNNSRMGMNPIIGGQTIQNSSGGFLKNLLNPEAASGMFSNIQKVMGVANQVGPMVQQYGPMVKNLPTLIKLYKEINSDDEETETDVQSIEEELEVPTEEEEELVTVTKQRSKPRLYI